MSELIWISQISELDKFDKWFAPFCTDDSAKFFVSDGDLETRDLQVLTVSAPPSKRIRGTQAGKTVETHCVTGVTPAVPFDSDSTAIQKPVLIYARWAMRALRTRPRTCHFSIQRAVCAEGWMISGADGADTHGGYVWTQLNNITTWSAFL